MPFLTLTENVANSIATVSKVAGFIGVPGAADTILIDAPAYAIASVAGGTKWLIDVDEAAGS